MTERRYLIDYHFRHHHPGLYILALVAERAKLQREAERLIERGCLAQAGMALQKADELIAAVRRAQKSRR